MRIVITVAALLVAAFMFGQCAGNYMNQRTERIEDTAFGKRLSIEERQ